MGVVEFSAENAGEATFDLTAPTYNSTAGSELPIESAQAVEQVSNAPSAIRLDQVEADISTSHIMVAIAALFTTIGTLAALNRRKR